MSTQITRSDVMKSLGHRDLKKRSSSRKNSTPGLGSALAVLVLFLATLFSGSQIHATGGELSPITGPIAEDIISIGDRQFGTTDFIKDRDGLFTRHQRVDLGPISLMCNQYPRQAIYRFTRFIAFNQVNKESLDTFCYVNESQASGISSNQNYPSLREIARASASPVNMIHVEGLENQMLKTERAYCLINFEARDFIEPMTSGTWLAQGTQTTFNQEMFVGFRVMGDAETGAVFAFSEPVGAGGPCPAGSNIIAKLSIQAAQ